MRRTKISWFAILMVLAFAGAGTMVALYRGAQESLAELTLSPLDNNTWAAVQVQLEYERLRSVLRAARLADPDVTLESIGLRVDIIHSRIGVLEAGDVGFALARLPSHSTVMEVLRSAMQSADLILASAEPDDVGDVARRLDGLLEPLDSTIKRFTVEVVQSSAAFRHRHEAELAALLVQLRWISIFVGAGLLGGASLLALQNRRLRASERGARKMLHELTEANAAKSRFLANMSHELRTPLNAVLGFSDVMRQQMLGPLPVRYAGYVRDIHASGEHLLGLIEDVLNMARIDAGHAELKMEWVALSEIIDSALLVTRPQAELGHVTLQLPPAPDVEVLVDARALRQVLVNLLSNAVKFTERGGRVSCRVVQEPRGGLHIDVEDTGMGIPPDDLAKVTQPFHRGANATAAAVGGTGLGLAITKTLIELHDGRLELISALGEGTRARIVLPAARLRPRTATGLRASA
ncbi:MAG: HAMP domain-containing histidine kinase [Alphaproteobacteria bacterium]|nr:HAMP domain-containing histidine kinase [Alphaproteobacteria bacterium]